ncbi:uncharacterized protein VICG_00839 [Vittaforma corneae ATCC 50505]|uniref:Uncharacterized protein n=1 Tax=Vittaforma corneae (strain ATCC 50505) TaxID=993615 RepID=L2GMZ6_VITCO|nr:uncharacterized protein VICG_00839 [Vittaforma corneae ATCC 50505]ELA42196.1 hypothetical protein VICG_00839 [Vittaforma corneae ATCC 50505]
MRGSEKLKAILETNRGTQSILIKCLVVYNLLALFMYWHKKASFFAFLLLSTAEVVATVFIFKFCKPKIVYEEQTKRLVDVTSINAPGPVSFCWDVLFWAMVAKILTVFSWKWMCVYLGIFISFFFEFIYRPYKKLKTGDQRR